MVKKQKNFFSRATDACKKGTVATLCMLLILLFASASCEKPENACTCEKPEKDDPDVSRWKSILAPDVTLTLTIDSLQHKMYVSTSPPYIDFQMTGWHEMLIHGDTLPYSLAGDTMFITFPHIPNHYYGAWIKTITSADSMQLDYWGYRRADSMHRIRFSYSFSRLYGL